MKDEKLEKIATQHYDSKLRYHNFDHIRYVLEAGNNITEKCKVEGVEINEAVVYYAILFHDAGYGEDHISKGYNSKEAYSVDLAVQGLQGNGIDADMIQRVKDAIMATHVDALCETNEDKAVRAADLSGLADDYKVFKKNTIDLKDELEMMSGKSITWDGWKAMAIDRIELFLRQELKLTSDYYNDHGESVFHLKTRENLKILLQDKSEQIDV